MKKTFATLALTLALAGTALASETVAVVDTATTLDVKELVSVAPSDASFADVCGIADQTMTYIDSKGVLTQTTYKRHGTGCNG